ncbi:MAG: hypothetical protein OXS28_13780, partial [Gammaproteobacteria bacterium]|nr:hypothetical protein [Gammaproteobacteria bacterium]
EEVENPYDLHPEDPAEDEETYVEPDTPQAPATDNTYEEVENPYDLHPEDPAEDDEVYENPVPDPGYETVGKR